MHHQRRSEDCRYLEIRRPLNLPLLASVLSIRALADDGDGIRGTANLLYTGLYSIGSPTVTEGSGRSLLFHFSFFIKSFQEYRIRH